MLGFSGLNGFESRKGMTWSSAPRNAPGPSIAARPPRNSRRPNLDSIAFTSWLIGQPQGLCDYDNASCGSKTGGICGADPGLRPDPGRPVRCGRDEERVQGDPRGPGVRPT